MTYYTEKIKELSKELRKINGEIHIYCNKYFNDCEQAFLARKLIEKKHELEQEINFNYTANKYWSV